MASNPNALQWDGAPGHYEVYYVSLTDRGTGRGFWIRYTMVAPDDDAGAEATCSLWLMAMDPQRPGASVGRKTSLPVSDMVAKSEPFELRIGDAVLSDRAMKGGFGDVSWDIAWAPTLPVAEHVHPLLRRARIAKTILLLPHPDVEMTGHVTVAGERTDLRGARGGQAHLWGSKHAARWTWAHCNDFESLDGQPRPDTYFDGVSVFVPRFGRELGPNSPIVGRFGGRDFRSTGPLTVTRNSSRFGLTSWHLEAADGDRRIVADVEADREALVGVTYHDPDGEEAYCYNAETASMQLRVWEGDQLVEELTAPGRAHFEYAQREPVPRLELQVK
jgi:hypothetical protein